MHLSLKFESKVFFSEIYLERLQLTILKPEKKIISTDNLELPF